MKDNIEGQINLFGEAEAQGNAHVSIPIPEVEEFSPMELMAMEKETTGLYLSGHPMDSYKDIVRRIGAAPLGAIMSDFAADGGPRHYADNQTVTVAGVVDSAKTRTTKNKTLMSYVQLEDDTGSMELMVFQRALDQGGAFLKENSVIVVRGRISARDDKEPQLMVDSIMPIEDAAQAYKPQREPRSAAAQGQKLWVKLKGQDDPELKRIQLILTMFPGSDQMIIYCEAENKRIGAHCLIHPALVEELEERLGKENVVVK
jgi:DNA polymerase-3 subunit alpha